MEVLDVFHRSKFGISCVQEVRWKGSVTKNLDDYKFMWSGKVEVDSEGIKTIWKEYMEKLLNEENIWDQSADSDAKDGPACILR